jgi:beta-glucosidase
MCSYNRINGVYSCENDWLLNKLLRDEWGFKGLVMTDWGAMDDRIAAIKAGLDLEMPSSNGIRDTEIVEAVNNGSLAIEVVDKTVERILTLIKNYFDNKKAGAVYDKEEHHALARSAATESAVLLKNNNILPLKADTKAAFIGEFAKTPRFQGGGSSHINCFKITNAVDAVKEISDVTYAQGFITTKDETDEKLVREAVKAASEAEVAVIFAGLPDSFESEGYDRTHLNLPECQNHLIHEILKVQKNVVIVLHNGSPVLMPWKNDVKAILTMYMGGQAVGEATVDLLYGKVNPSGKLAETYPLRLQDTPSYLNFPGTEQEVVYSEGVFIGYRYYDTKELDVLYPFGHGLSYTTFEYSDLLVTPETNMKDTDTIQVSVKVKNTGSVFGKEIVQLYIHPNQAFVRRPYKELKGFEKVALNPGETKTVTFILDKRSFAYYQVDLKDWFVESGEYKIMIGKSSLDIALTETIKVEGTVDFPFTASNITTISDIYKYVKNPDRILNKIKEKADLGIFNDPDNAGTEEISARMMREMFAGTTLHSLLSFAKGLTTKDIQDFIDEINKK